jgi:hypothetical protein
MNTSERILMQLKMRGPQTAQALAAQLDLTSMAYAAIWRARSNRDWSGMRTAGARSGARCGAGA